MTMCASLSVRVDAHAAHLGLGFVYLYGKLRVCGKCAPNLDLRQLLEVAK
jgi:hypothetical protein